QNIRHIDGTLQNVDALTRSIADQREDLRALIVNARRSSEQLEATLTHTRGAAEKIDRQLADRLPGLIAKLDHTLDELDSAASGANRIVTENR
ncbi:hypothetical protein NYY92_18145, partial [Acinetobacter baumannii]|nr:hypothetical protein [Acinetobacter baumannii]